MKPRSLSECNTNFIYRRVDTGVCYAIPKKNLVPSLSGRWWVPLNFGHTIHPQPVSRTQMKQWRKKSYVKRVKLHELIALRLTGQLKGQL